MPTVTYTPADDKLRLYVGRVPRVEYETLRAAGFVSTPKQDCDFAAVWTPYREDLARQYLEDGEDIEDEDYSPTERAADRAERFDGYREKRTDEATEAADRAEAGPAAFGHQNRGRAERAARRADRVRNYAVSQWSKAEYWQERTRAVIAHALHRENPRTRRGRILTIEAEQRKLLKEIAEAQARFDGWHDIATSTDPTADQQLPEDGGTLSALQAAAYRLANSASLCDIPHPTDAAVNAKAAELRRRGLSPYDLLCTRNFAGVKFEPLTPRQLGRAYCERFANPSNPDTSSQRWARHLELRLSYERAMLEAEGGTAAAVEMEPGGWLGKYQIHKVNKSPATGRVVSCLLASPGDDGDSWDYRKRGKHTDEAGQVWTLYQINVERLPESAYRAPTDEERKRFAESKKAAPKSPPLINPTAEDAARLQAIWNTPSADNERAYLPEKRGQVDSVTQAQYTSRSKSDIYQTVAIDDRGRRARYSKRPSVAKIRVRMSLYGVNSVIHLTDKPGKPLPIDWTAAEAPAETAAAV